MAKGVSVDLIVDPKKALDGLDQVSSKSNGVAGVLSGLGGAAAAGVAALGTAAIGAVTALTAATKSAGEYAEQVQNASSKTHLTTDAVQELQYASKITGVDFETITGSLTKLTKAMGTAEAGNATTADAFAKLGVATTDANGNLRDSTQVYSDVISALSQVSNPAERDVLAMTLLGKSATDLNPLIDGTAGSLSDLAAQAHDAGAVLSTDMLAKLSSVDDAFDSLQAGADAAKNALGLTLMPILQELGDQGTGLLGEFTHAVLDANGDLSQAAPAIGDVFGKAASFLLTQIPKFLEVGTSIIGSILTGIAKQAPDLIKQAVPVLAGFVVTLLGQLPMLLDAGLKVVIALIQGISAALPTLIPAAVNAISGLVTALIDNLPMLIDGAIQLVMGLSLGIVEALPQLIDAGIQLVIGLALGLVAALPQLIDKIPEIITKLIVALVGAIPQLAIAGVQLLVGLISNLPAIIEGIVSSTPQIIDGLVKAFSDPKFLRQMGDAGMQLINGLWDGIKGAGDWLWEQIQGFFGDVIDNIKNLFGIHSPSTVFAGFGKNMIQGLEVGLSGRNNLSSIMGGLSDQVAGGFSASLSVQARNSALGATGGGEASPVVAAASSPQVTQTIYMLPEQDPRIAGRQFGREFARTMAGTP